MSKKPLEQLKRRVGEPINEVLLEYWIAEDDELESMIAVGITFSSGISFILGCAGDGSVSVRKGELKGIPDETQIRCDDSMKNTVLNAVSISDGKIEFSTSSDTLVVSNVCDEIEVTKLPPPA